MSAEKAHLFGLIGLRALAEWDIVEYRRVSELAVGDLDRRIQSRLKEVGDSECDALYRQIVEPPKSAEALPAAQMRMQQIYLTSASKSQYESARVAEDRPRGNPRLPSDIVTEKLEAAGLRWSDIYTTRLETDLKALDRIVAEGSFPGALFECLGDVVQDLAADESQVGFEQTMRSVALQCCTEILEICGWRLQPGVDAASLWRMAREGRAQEWLVKNSLQAGKSPVSKGRSRAKRSRR